jgi:hypothetical protein
MLLKFKEIKGDINKKNIKTYEFVDSKNISYYLQYTHLDAKKGDLFKIRSI